MIAGVGEITRILPPREHKLSCNLSRGINYAIDAELFVVCRLCKHFRSGNRRIVSTVNFVTSGTFNALRRSLWFNTKIKITFGLSIEWQAGDSTSGLPKLQGIPRCGDVKKKKKENSLCNETPAASHQFEKLIAAYPASRIPRNNLYSRRCFQMRFNIYAAPGHARITLFNICERTKKVNSHYSAKRSKEKIHKYARAFIHLIKSTIVNSSWRSADSGCSSEVQTLRHFSAKIASLMMARSYQTRRFSSIIESIAATQRHFRILTSRQCHYYDLPRRAIDPPPPSPLTPWLTSLTSSRRIGASREQRRERAKERPRVSAKFCRGEREGGGGEEGDELISRWC